MMRVEVLVGGFGGQGVLSAGAILGEAAVYDGKKVVLTRSYGAEARGGAARSETVISDEEINYPLIIEADALIAMSQLAFDRYITRVKPNGMVIIDEDMVKQKQNFAKEFKIVQVPATRISAEELKQPVTANMIMLGVLIALTGVVREESLIKSIEKNLPKDTVETNIKAFKKGLELVKYKGQV
jgi:2-oxoglutarate ferredoxin oxidoreductase subunit gamma